jgi:phosphoglucosamine mutase
MNMGRLFGTDGIRGAANHYPLTAEMAQRVGWAVASIFKGANSQRKIIIGKDTRESCDMLESALASGICSAGADACLTGILPTPAVAYLTAAIDACAGIMISASHNPFYDNGIKIFDSRGFKLDDHTEAQLECLILDHKANDADCKSVRKTGSVEKFKDAAERYLDFLKHSLPAKTVFKDMKIIVDCSNGATYAVAPQLFHNLGAQVEAIGANPDGKNINAGCGSENPETLIDAVIAKRADIGLAFDGDGDRLIAVDENGQLTSGDRILAIFAKAFKQKGLLKNNVVVSTVMSNLGLRLALKNMGIRYLMAPVGDRYVLQQMQVAGAIIGGEDSGHMIFLDRHTTGDGMLAAIGLLQVMQDENKPLSELSRVMMVFPQVLLNIEVKKKPEIESVPQIKDAIRGVEDMLGEQGRVLVRYSGTEPLCRVMVEGPDEEETRRYCQQIADVVKAVLG